MGNNVNIWDILEEKTNALKREQLEKARNDPEVAALLYVLGDSEVEKMYHHHKLPQNYGGKN